MALLTIVADIRAKVGQEGLVKGELEKLIGPTLGEAGCVQYDMHEDNEDPTHFLFFENWESRELWQDHMGSTHLKAFQASTDGAVESVAIYEMTKVE